jgi:thioredoxin-dependent peroxiredoxin
MRLAVVPLLLAVLAAGRTPQVSAQTKAILISGPDVGRRAPDFTLPWASKDGVGPVELPYQLRRDEGRTVVLAFYPRAFTQSSAAQLRSFSEQYDSLFGPGVTVVGISTDPVEVQGRFAAQLGVPFRLLSDPDQRVARKYGSDHSDGFSRRTVYVIGPDGNVRYRNLRFDPLDPQQYAALKVAVRAARGG